jgi:hypothetical protein
MLLLVCFIFACTYIDILYNVFSFYYSNIEVNVYTVYKYICIFKND